MVEMRVINCYYCVVGCSFVWCSAPDTHHCQNEDCPAYFTRRPMNTIVGKSVEAGEGIEHMNRVLRIRNSPSMG